MKQVYRSKSNVLFSRPQLCGKARSLKVGCTIDEAVARLEHAANELVKNARWSGFMSPINELRRPLLELKLARRKKAQQI
jgi:hypothetical protein